MVESTPSTSTSSSRSSVPPRDNHQHDDRIIAKDERCCTCCTAQSCSSCTASCVADCVAVCCCPCAIVNLFVLAFVKVPCLVGKRCVRVLVGKSRGRMRILMSKNNKKNNKKDDEKMMMMIMGGVIGEEYQSTLERCGGNHNNYLEGYCGRDVNIIGDGSEEELVVEGDERVWWELYQVGHWGFGRLSFSGNNNNNNNNNNHG